MNLTPPVSNGSPHLEKKIREKIAHIQDIEEVFPGAVIIHDLRTREVVYMSEWGRDYLNISLEALQQMGTEYFNYFFNPEESKEYIPKIIGMLERNNDSEFITYFQQVRRSPEDDWNWFLSSARILLWDDKGMPLLTFTLATPVDAQHQTITKVNRLQEENNFIRKNSRFFKQLTPREKQVLTLIAKGKSAGEISASLSITEATASTHRRNIKRKLQIETSYDITRFAQAFDLI